MDVRQKLQLRRLLIPHLSQSLKILALPLTELRGLVEAELEQNPFLEEVRPPPSSTFSNVTQEEQDYRISQITRPKTLQDSLLEQLGIAATNDEELRIGQELIGNIDQNGYLKASLEYIASTLQVSLEKVKSTLEIIHDFEPVGIGALNLEECLLLQLEAAGFDDPRLIEIIRNHLPDIAKKNYTHIAKALKISLEEVKPLISRIASLDPKPGLIYSQEELPIVVPDVTIEEKDKGFEISISNGQMPIFRINDEYRDAMRENPMSDEERAILKKQLDEALFLVRAVAKRKETLVRVVESLVGIQSQALRHGLTHLKPLTFRELARQLGLHETTIGRTVAHKYIKLKNGTVALKDFFSGKRQDKNGHTLSATYINSLIRSLIDVEDKTKPLSDQDIAGIISHKYQVDIPRRTIAQYRRQLRIASSSYRKNVK